MREVSGSPIRPPDGEVPAGVPLIALLGRTPALRLVSTDLFVYSTGFTFRCCLFARDPASALIDEWAAAWTPAAIGTDFDLAVGFEDGVEFRLHPHRTAGGAEPLFFMEGWTRERQSCQTVFVPRLPPGGRVTISAGWPSRGVPPSTFAFDASLLLDARARVVQVWEEGG
jgi:hypothetical protein